MDFPVKRRLYDYRPDCKQVEKMFHALQRARLDDSIVRDHPDLRRASARVLFDLEKSLERHATLLAEVVQEDDLEVCRDVILWQVAEFLTGSRYHRCEPPFKNLRKSAELTRQRILNHFKLKE